MKNFLTAGAAIAIAMTSVPLSAQTPPPPGVAQGTAPMPVAPPPATGVRPDVHMMIMTNREMTRAEVSDHVGKLFARLDANHDGFITHQELDALHSKMMMGMDGMNRGAEAMSRAARAMSVSAIAPGMAAPDRGAAFERLDTNHDGSISRQEFMAAKPQIREQRFVIRDGNAPGAPGAHGERRMMMRMHGGGEGMGHGFGMAGFGARLFDMADTNHDGRVSLAEAQTAALAHFDRADMNHDGKITPDERQQIRQTIRLELRAS